MKVLCVEDNSSQRRMIDLMLAATGIDVDFATDGREAVEAYTVNEYDAVLMDVEMPVMSGIQATREIRQMEEGFHLHYTPILFVSGTSCPDRANQGFEAGGDALLSKPFTTQTLMGALDRVLRERGGLPPVLGTR